MANTPQERARLKTERYMWLKREEIILNHLRMTEGIFYWLYRIMGITVLLSALAILTVGLVGRNLYCVLVAIPLVACALKLIRRKHSGKHDSAYAEVEAAIEAVRRGESESFPPEYTPETQKLRNPLLGATSGQFAVVAVILFCCAALCIGMAVFFMIFLLQEAGPSGLFWGFSPAYIFLILIGLPLGAMGVGYAVSAWNVRKWQGGLQRC